MRQSKFILSISLITALIACESEDPSTNCYDCSKNTTGLSVDTRYSTTCNDDERQDLIDNGYFCSKI